MIIAQISDSHLALDAPSRSTNLADCVAYINALDVQPDVVVHSGDITHNALQTEYELAHELMAELRARYFVIPGNKDSRAHLTKIFADHGLDNLETQFIQYAISSFPVRMLFLDTLSADSNKGTLCGQRLEQFKQMLVQDRSKPTCIFMHHPSFDVTTGKDPFQFESRDVASRFAQIVEAAPNVVSVFCGHVHRDFEGTVGTVPATTISAMALDLRRGTYEGAGKDAPLIQIHGWDKARGFTTRLVAAQKRDVALV